MNKLIRTYLALGSNLTNEMGSPMDHLLNAIKQMVKHTQLKNIQPSSFYISKPYGVTDQPDFINAVVGCDTSLTPFELLKLCQSLEADAKRERLRHWGERSLDVDILLYGNEVINTPDLNIPHIEMYKRNFVLVPLFEIAPDLCIQKRSIKDIPISRDWEGLELII